MSQEIDMLRMLEPAVRPAGAPAPTVRPTAPLEQRDFDQLLQEADAAARAEGLKYSAHAQQRMEQMGLELTDPQAAALNDAAEQARAKGSRDALILMRDLGLIVNVPNRTVVTVLDAQRMQSGIVTQIDSTVLVGDPEAIADPNPTEPDHGLAPHPSGYGRPGAAERPTPPLAARS